MRSGAERRGSSAAAPPGSPPTGRARPAGPDAPPAPPPPAAGQPRARDTGDARAQPRPLFPWSKWKKRMGSSMSAATARRPVFDDKEDGENGRGGDSGPLAGTALGPAPSGDSARSRSGAAAGGFLRVGAPRPPGGKASGASRFPRKLANGACDAHARLPCPVAARRAE